MSKFKLFLISICIGLLIFSFAWGQDIKLDIQTHQLKNGLRILTVEDHTLPVCTYYTFFKVGSRNERPGITGISHLFEHMMFNGAKRYGPKEFDRVLESNGGYSNAYTTFDFTAYYEDFASDKLELIIDLDSDRMENLLLSDENLGSEREVVKEERRLRTDNDNFGKLEEQLYAAAFYASPYHWPVVGWMEDLNAITREDCVNYFKTFYAPNNATIIIVGDFDSRQALQLIEKYYSHISTGPPPPKVVNAEPEQKGEKRIWVHKTAQLPSFLAGYKVPAADNEDVFVLDIIATLLTNGESSRLYKKLVYDLQMALNVQASYFWTVEPNLFYFYVEMKPGFTCDQAEKVLYEEIEKLKNEFVTDKELQKAKNILEAGFVKQFKTNNGRANNIGYYNTVFGDYNMMFQTLDKYRKVTKEDIQRIIKKYFDVQNRTVAILVPEQEEITP